MFRSVLMDGLDNGLHCVECTQEHIDQLKVTMRESDRIELYLSSGQPPEECLEDSFKITEKTYTWLKNETVLCVFGVAPYKEGMGVPWLVASEDFLASARTLARVCKDQIVAMSAGYSLLLNAVHAENAVAVHWLERCGFTMHTPYRTDQGAMFIPFSMEIESNV